MAIDGHRSTFPTTVDTFVELSDLLPSEIASAQRWQTLKLQASKSSDEINEFNTLTTQLATKIFTPEKLNTLEDCIFNLETFFKNSVEGYIETKQTEFDTTINDKEELFNATLAQFSNKDNWSGTTTYAQWNTVLYNYETYMSKQNNNLNHIPVGDITDLYWQKMSLRGATGAAGLGLSYMFNYNNATAYTVGNAVKYIDNNIYYCINNSTGHIPTDINYWSLFMSATGIAVQSIAPTSLYDGLLWIDTSSVPNLFKRYNGSIWVILGTSASQVSIADSGNLITATDVEGALQEIFTNFNSHKTDNSKQIPHIGTTTNVSNAYSVNTTEVIETNQKFTVKINAVSTGTATLSVSTIASGVAKGIKKAGGLDAILKIGIYTMFWDGTSFQLLGEGGDYGTAGAPQTLTGYSIGTDSGLVNGTMPDRAGDTVALANSLTGTTLKLRASDGYRDGIDDNVTIDLVTVDADHVPSNIKAGVTDLGVLGTFTSDATATASKIVTGYSAYVNGNKINGTGEDPTTKKKTASGGPVTCVGGQLIVSGLTFTPRHIDFVSADGNNYGHYNADFSTTNFGAHSYGGFSIPVTNGSGYINGSGFSLTAGGASGYYWFASE